MIEGPVYGKYEKAIRKFWSVEDLDFTQDANDWNRIDDEQRRGLLGVTVRFLAGEQNVTDELVPMLVASHALNRFDWIVYLSTFLMEEAKHAEFFGHRLRLPRSLEVPEVVPPARSKPEDDGVGHLALERHPKVARSTRC